MKKQFKREKKNCKSRPDGDLHCRCCNTIYRLLGAGDSLPSGGN